MSAPSSLPQYSPGRTVSAASRSHQRSAETARRAWIEEVDKLRSRLPGSLRTRRSPRPTVDGPTNESPKSRFRPGFCMGGHDLRAQSSERGASLPPRQVASDVSRGPRPGAKASFRRKSPRFSTPALSSRGSVSGRRRTIRQNQAVDPHPAPQQNAPRARF